MKINNDSMKINPDLGSSKANSTDKNSKIKKNDLGANGNLANKISDKSIRDASAQVNLSQRAQDMQKIKDIAMSTPDVDESKVKKFQELIDKGLYKVDAGKVADKMVEDSLLHSFGRDD